MISVFEEQVSQRTKSSILVMKCSEMGKKSIIMASYIYYSNYDKHHCTDFHWAQWNEPTTLALGNFRCFSLISTKFAVVIATAIRHRFICNHILDGPVHARWSKNAKYGFLQKYALFSNGDCYVQNFSYLLQTSFNRILKGWKCVPRKH